MRPNDENGTLPPGERPFRVLLLSGSDCRQYNCPGVDSKSRALMLRMADRLPQEWEIDAEDLGNVYGRPRIQSCNVRGPERYSRGSTGPTATRPRATAGRT
jgi:hypothetical protein